MTGGKEFTTIPLSSLNEHTQYQERTYLNSRPVFCLAVARVGGKLL